MRLTIDLRDVRDGGARSPEDAIGRIRKALADDGYAVTVSNVGETPQERDHQITEQRRREILAESPLGAQVLQGTAK